MGNDNLRRSQIALETTYGTPVAVSPTVGRQLVGALSLKNAPERVLREEYRASMGASNTYDDLSYKGEGTYNGRCVTSELPYFLSSAIIAGVAPVVSGVTGQKWIYTMPFGLPVVGTLPTALNSLTLYAGDQIQALRAAGCYVSRIVIRGDNTGAWTIEVTFLTREVVTAGAAFELTKVNPRNLTMKNVMGTVAIDPATAAAPGVTKIPGTYYSFVWTWDSGIAPDYTMDGAGLDMSGIHRDAPSATLELTSKWNGPIVTEHGYWRTIAPRLIRLESSREGTDGVIGAGPAIHTTTIDGCYVYTDFTPLDSERNGTTLGRATLAAVENTVILTPGATWLKKVEVAVITDVATIS